MKRKGQITLEACLLIIAIVSAGLSMQGYLRRAIQGNWRANADSFSDEQYEAGRSQEQVTALRFIAPRITANVSGSSTQEFNLAGSANGSGILHIKNWSAYPYEEEKKQD